MTGGARQFVQGWQVGVVANYASGVPFTPFIGFDYAKDLSSDTEAVYVRALEFLGLPAQRLSQYPPHNVRRYPPMRPGF